MMMSNEMSEALLQKIDEVKKQMTEVETQEGVVLGTYAGQKVIKTAPLEALVKKLYVSTEKYDYNVPGLLASSSHTCPFRSLPCLCFGQNNFVPS